MRRKARCSTVFHTGSMRRNLVHQGKVTLPPPPSVSLLAKPPKTCRRNAKKAAASAEERRSPGQRKTLVKAVFSARHIGHLSRRSAQALQQQTWRQGRRRISLGASRHTTHDKPEGRRLNLKPLEWTFSTAPSGARPSLRLDQSSWGHKKPTSPALKEGSHEPELNPEALWSTTRV